MSPEDSRISRRQVLWGAAGSAAAALAGVWWWRSSSPLGVEDLADATVAAAALGERYFEQEPEERDEATLVSRLEKGLAHGPEPSLPARVKARIQSDFEEGDVVTVDGWQLSRTEARFYALAALRSGR